MGATRRQSSREFKLEAVRQLEAGRVEIVEQEGGTVATAAEARTILGVESHRRSSSEHIVGP